MWTLLFLMLSLGVLGVLMAIQARGAYHELQSAEDSVPGLRKHLMRGDQQKLARSVEEISRHTRRAQEALSGPHWAAAERVPFVGADVESARTIAAVADDLAAEVLPELVRASAIITRDELKPDNGRIPLQPLRRLHPHVERANDAARDGHDRLRSVDPGGVLAAVRERYEQLDDQVAALDVTTGALAQATRLLPNILGGDRPRRYVVLVQNNSEPRTLGGIVGSVIELRADDGRIELVSQRAGGSFDGLAEPVVPLTSSEVALYNQQLGRYMQNITNSPDFVRVAELAEAFWMREVGRPLDGVLALDPVVLEGLLHATGPVALPDGRRLTAKTAAQLLLNQVYLDIDNPVQQDEFFAQAAATIFARVTGGGLDLPRAAESLVTATGQGRLLFWSKHRREQRQLRGTALSGPLGPRNDSEQPTIGLFVHDSIGSKMGYYERVRARATPVSCEPGKAVVDVTVEISNTAPLGAAKLPLYVTGDGSNAPRGHLLTQVYLYAPVGAEITSFVSSKGPKQADLTRYLGRQVASWPAALAPGSSLRLAYRITGVQGSLEELRLRMTPGPSEDHFRHSTLPCA